MKYRPLDDGSYRVHFDTAEYNVLLDTTPNRPARLAARLMAHSPRVKTASGVTLDRFTRKETPHGPIWTLYVEAKDTTDRDSSLLPREVWICEPLIREIEDYTGVEDLDAHDEPTPLFQVSKRTIQNWVTKTAENAATKTGDEDYLKVSSHDFRRYFAVHMLYRHGVDAEIVRQLGGWRSPRSMMEYLLLPDDVLAEELGETGLLGAEADKQPSEGTPYREKTALETLATKVETGDHSEQLALAKEMQAVFDDIDDVDVAVAGASGTAERAADAIEDSHQSSFPRLEGLGTDESGRLSPLSAAKIAYVTAVTSAAWVATIGPLG